MIRCTLQSLDERMTRRIFFLVRGLSMDMATNPRRDPISSASARCSFPWSVRFLHVSQVLQGTWASCLLARLWLLFGHVSFLFAGTVLFAWLFYLLVVHSFIYFGWFVWNNWYFIVDHMLYYTLHLTRGIAPNSPTSHRPAPEPTQPGKPAQPATIDPLTHAPACLTR